MIIDFHEHCFPDSLAPRALSALKLQAENNSLFPCTDGTRTGTEKHMAASGIDRAVICNIATNAKQQHNVNSFAIELSGASRCLFPLGSLHSDGEDKESELSRLADAGIHGIKIHPDYVGVDIDDPKYDRIFSLCEERGFFVVTHAGLDPVSPEHIHATPDGILNVITRHPSLKLVAAHMGGFKLAEGVLEKLVGKNIWFDTSLCSHRPNEYDDLVKILHRHSPDRLLFATDTPWSFATEEIDFIKKAVPEDGLREKIFHLNAEKLLGI